MRHFSARDISDLELHGVTRPVAIFDPVELQHIAEELERLEAAFPETGPAERHSGLDLRTYWSELGQTRIWFKSLHAYSQLLTRVASHPVIAECIYNTFGSEAWLWGVQNICQKPQVRHRWHVDVEAYHWRSVNIWLGVVNTSCKSGLKVIPGTHRTRIKPQDRDRFPGLDLESDSEVARVAAQHGASGQVQRLDVRPGEVVAFDGRLWHSSANDTDQERRAVLMQYSPDKAAIRIPTSFSDPVTWHDLKPPVYRVGSGRAVNAAVPIPTVSSGE